MTSTPHDPPFPHLDDLRLAYDRDASDDASFLALTFEGFEPVRRELLPAQTPDGLHPQLLVLRSTTV